jgi:transposase
MAKPLLPDGLWQRIEPLLPPPKPRRFRYPGRQPVGNRPALTGILFVLKTGIPWEDLPQEMGCGSGMTCWRRLRDWHHAGVWDRLVAIFLDELHGADRIDWSRAAIDSGMARALGGVEDSGPNPTDRGRPGVKHHVLVDGHGAPLAIDVTGGQHARRQPPGAAGRERARGPRPAGPAAAPPGGGVRGPGVRLPAAPGAVAAARDHAPVGAAGDRTRQRAGGVPLGG